MRAEFAVNDDLDESLRVGLFATPGKTFKAWIRYSNAAVVKGELTVYRRGSSIVYRLADRRWRAAHSGVA